METLQNIVQAPIQSLRSTVMAPSNDTSFAGHVASQFTSYEKDRQMKSTETTYASSNGAPQPFS
jgi:hypothetical protein